MTWKCFCGVATVILTMIKVTFCNRILYSITRIVQIPNFIIVGERSTTENILEIKSPVLTKGPVSLYMFNYYKNIYETENND